MQDKLAQIRLKILREKIRGGARVSAPGHPNVLPTSQLAQRKDEEQRERGPDANQIAPDAVPNIQSIPIQYASATNGLQPTAQSNISTNNTLPEQQQIAPATGVSQSVASHVQQPTQPAIQPPQQGINMDEVLRNITLQNFQLQQMLLQNTLVAQVSASQQSKSFDDVMCVYICC
jgi:hypothetical protein